MSHKTVPCAFVVVRCDNKETVCTECGVEFCIFNCVSGAVCACANDDRQFALEFFHDRFNHCHFFFFGHGCRFTRCAEYDKGVYATVHLIVKDFVQRFEVNTVVGEGSDESSCRAFEHIMPPVVL